MKTQISLLFFLFFTLSLSAQTEIQLDLNNYPFSHYGSYMSIINKKGPDDKKSQLYLQDVSGRRLWHWKGVFRIETTFNGEIVESQATSTPSMLSLKANQGSVEICFENPNVIRFKGSGVGLILTQTVKDGSSVSFPITKDGQQWRCQQVGYSSYVFTEMKGKVTGDPAKTVIFEPIPDRPQLIMKIKPDKNGVFEAAFEQYYDAWATRKYEKSFEQCVEDTKNSIAEFDKKVLPTPTEYSEMRQLAVYTKWSSVVGVKGFIQREAMYCSKNNMNAIWAWDNCFGAMATCYTDMNWTLDQILVMFDHQSDKGSLPDHLTDDHPMWGSYKPPIQGLAMMKILEYSTDNLTIDDFNKIYEPFARFTYFWFNYMDDNKNGIPQYNHANDSGEDNGSVFECGYPTESPDLCTYLILQMDFLEKSAIKLGKNEEAKEWKLKSQRLMDYLIKDLWTGEKFVAKNSFTEKYDDDANSFLQYTPILLGDKLPKDIKEKLIKKLKAPNSIITPYGPASEHPDSKYFYEDSYWRGAVWAPQ